MWLPSGLNYGDGRWAEVWNQAGNVLARLEAWLQLTVSCPGLHEGRH